MPQEMKIRDSEGIEGRLIEEPGQPHYRVVLADGRTVLVKKELVQEKKDGYYLPVSLMKLAGEETLIPVLREEVHIDRKTSEQKVQIKKEIEHRTESIEEPIEIDAVEVERVPVNRFVDKPPQVREEDGVTIYPVLEEVVVFEKRLMLKEEVHVRRKKERKMEHKEVTLRTEKVSVSRSG